MKYFLLLLLFSTIARADYTQYPPVSGGGGGAVSSVFGRTGAVTAVGSDYSAFYQSVRIVNSVSSAFTIPTLSTDYILNVNTTGGAVTITMPTAIASNKFCVKIKNIGSPANTITVNSVLAQTIDGNASFAITGANDAFDFCSVSNNWFIY